ncbi:transglycosylase domain-containing protein [Fictibacillus gelatini]|uniref:transglycosylase domain-containing protein n=1 Tax=Fictibacillus gelatini TaxID=225985 RepID=UPI0003F8398F|nr:PBP1A family penicillin-binding protein [Fictibacillus gelatini]
MEKGQHQKRFFKKGKRAFFAKLALVAGGFMFASFLGLLLAARMMGPPPILVPQTTIIHANDGSVIGEVKPSGQNRYWVPLNKISPALVNATVAIEDKNFYSHHGFDFKRIAGAILADIKAGGKVQGASTITQQYARNLFLTHDKTWTRKLMEAFYTLRLEMNYSKKEILEGYLNTIYYGHGAYGIQSAAEYYFGKEAKDLTLPEAAMIAGIPKGPEYYSPFSHLERAQQRQATILKAMQKRGIISKLDAVSARHAKLHFHEQQAIAPPKIAPYFQDEVMRILKSKLNLDPKLIDFGGLHIYTTLDVNMQEKAEQEVDEELRKNADIQAALVAMDPRNGQVKALVGGKDYEESPFNRATQATRAPGSTFKPFLYYSALENGYTPSTSIRSEPTTFAMGTGSQEYEPHNFNNRYAYDFITLAQALALSDNIYAVKTNLFLGPKKLVKTAHKFGIKSPLAPIPSLALGSKGTSVLEMTNAYNLFANGGKRFDPVFITKITDHSGKVIYENEKKGKQVLDRRKAFVMTGLLTGTFDERLNDYTKVTGASISKYLTRPAAGKSGSTPNDSWMIGFTPQLTTGVWVGYDQGRILDPVRDSSYSKKIWVKFMEHALEDQPVLSFKKPKGVVAVKVDPANGKRATKNCPVKRLTYYVKGTEPKDYCNEHGGHKKSKHQKKKEKSWFRKLFSW